MKSSSLGAVTTVLALTNLVSGEESFDPLKHLGGNGQWFSGPNVLGIDPAAPEGCTVDQAAFVSRHGSRYPDPGAYAEWTALEAKIKNATFTTNATELQFLHNWTPVLSEPSQQIAQLSTTGWKELYDMGAAFRLAYPSFQAYNTPFSLWANAYSSPRVLNSAQLFARGYLGPNATALGSIYVVNGSDPRSLANSLATSNLCPAYDDNGGGAPKDAWDATYLPPATARINSLLSGDLAFATTDVGIFAYLCGFETQIVGRRSPWCGTLTEAEFLQYEYAQDLRYWYGSGPGNAVAKATMLPFLLGLVQRFQDGPNATYVDSNGDSWTPPPLTAAFTNDGQVSQLAAAVGVFDNLPDLPGDHLLANRTFRASRYVTMKGTVGFERLNCADEGLYMRVKLNDVVYPIRGCEDGPGRSCGLDAYEKLLGDKLEAAGGFREVCNVTDTTVPEGEEKTTFLWDRALPFESLARP
ncbi:Histidine phosphatase superfamily clade-2 [Lasiodiplodia theobromae]|uniref:Histidine phosphatase superfamily clade-2 n=1 Tax=Lasiodiplodia theobromae TaxID=45133 RepID=UPI0015C37185|nr:Histidine phosphatase superfamily clade-2 [Lasiodiplodia theobromae]KAF4536891.1 Histidine phosphatase superfamily clade-2 [Lasiodiplodia theobromae]